MVVHVNGGRLALGSARQAGRQASKEGSKINGCLGGKFLLLFSWPSSKNLSLHSLEKGEIQYSLVSSVQ